MSSCKQSLIPVFFDFLNIFDSYLCLIRRQFKEPLPLQCFLSSNNLIILDSVSFCSSFYLRLLVQTFSYFHLGPNHCCSRLFSRSPVHFPSSPSLFVSVCLCLTAFLSVCLYVCHHSLIIFLGLFCHILI